MYPRPSYGYFLRRLFFPRSGPLSPLQLILSVVGILGAIIGALLYLVIKLGWFLLTALGRRRRCGFRRH